MRRIVGALIVLAAGSAGADCAVCGNDRETGGAGYLRLGGTLSQSWLLGFEASAWAKSEAGLDQSIGAGHFIVQWYPSRSGALYLKLGLGGMSYITNDGTDEYTATGGSGLFGIGYEIRLGRNMSVTPFLNSMASGNTEIEQNGTVVGTNADFKINMVQLGLGLTWH